MLAGQIAWNFIEDGREWDQERAFDAISHDLPDSSTIAPIAITPFRTAISWSSQQMRNVVFPGQMTMGVQSIDAALEEQVRAQYNGYLSLAVWNTTTSQTAAKNANRLSSFEAQWEVPPPPKTIGSQTILLFIGVQPEPASGVSAILKPVLQWGNVRSSGGSFWSVCSWYVRAQAQGNRLDVLARTKPVRVNVGQIVKGLIKATTTKDSTYLYTCEFERIPLTTLIVETMQQMTVCGVALEAYELLDTTGLPDTPTTVFSGVTVELGQYQTACPTWRIRNPASEAGVIATSVNHGGVEDEIDIAYRT
jgi:hypothetical protein